MRPLQQRQDHRPDQPAGPLGNYNAYLPNPAAAAIPAPGVMHRIPSAPLEQRRASGGSAMGKTGIDATKPCNKGQFLHIR